MVRAKKAKETAERGVKETKNIDVEKKVVELAKKGLTTEKIGLELKKEGIYVKSTLKKRIGKILEEKGMENNADRKNIEQSIEVLNTHLSTNKHDYPAKRAIFIKVALYNKFKQ